MGATKMIGIVLLVAGLFGLFMATSNTPKETHEGQFGRVQVFGRRKGNSGHSELGKPRGNRRRSSPTRQQSQIDILSRYPAD